MVRYRVVYDRENCIGAFVCSAIAPDFWVFNEDGKVDLKGAVFDSVLRRWVLEIGEAEFNDHEAAAQACPVAVIRVEKVD